MDGWLSGYNLAIPSVTGNGFTNKRGVFGKIAKPETVLCVAYGNHVTSCFSGGVEGVVHCWGGDGGNVLTRVVRAHHGPVFTLIASFDAVAAAIIFFLFSIFYALLFCY